MSKSFRRGGEQVASESWASSLVVPFLKGKGEEMECRNNIQVHGTCNGVSRESNAGQDKEGVGYK